MDSSDRFLFKRLETPKERMESFRLRYQVYCKECHFISEEDYPLGYECDGFDEHSLHFGAYDLAGNLVGGSRLILPECRKFPIEEHCPSLDIDLEKYPRQFCAEISRLTISKLYRRRADDGLYYGPRICDETVESGSEHFKRRLKPMAFGLYRAMYHESKRRNIRYWLALMEKTLWLLLKIHGFEFKPAGPQVEFYGIVWPFFADISEIEKNVYEKFPQFFQFFMQGLEPGFRPRLQTKEGIGTDPGLKAL